MTYDELAKIALSMDPNLDTVAEYQSIFWFTNSKEKAVYENGNYMEGIGEGIILRKDDGKPMSYSSYILNYPDDGKRIRKCKMKKLQKNDVYILSRMYVGEYLEREGKIGHEVINFFKDDNGDNYIYINENGMINKKYNDSVKGVLFVRYIELGVMEVIAKAENLTQIMYRRGDNPTELDEQIQYIRDNNIKYGGIYLSDVYNNYLDKKSITFKTDKIRFPKKAFYVIEDPSKKSIYPGSFFLPEKHFSRQSLKMYYSKNDFPEDYNIIESVINNNQLWQEENSTKKIDINDIEQINHGRSFLSIINKENDELVYSNLFKYIFEQNPQVFNIFVREILNINNFSKHSFQIIRESENNIDLWIEDENNIIVIENKIKSKIHGEKHNIYNNDIQSQLVKYYNYAREKADNKKTVNCFLFSPDYNNINLQKYDSGHYYNIIHYSLIHEFYKKYAGEMLDINYFRDFLYALSIHSKPIDNRNFEIMKEKFFTRIMKLLKENAN